MFIIIIYLEYVQSRLLQEERLPYPKISQINREILAYGAPIIFFAAIQSKYKIASFENSRIKNE